jgi:hypothetical protein
MTLSRRVFFFFFFIGHLSVLIFRHDSVTTRNVNSRTFTPTQELDGGRSPQAARQQVG